MSKLAQAAHLVAQSICQAPIVLAPLLVQRHSLHQQVVSTSSVAAEVSSSMQRHGPCSSAVLINRVHKKRLPNMNCAPCAAPLPKQKACLPKALLSEDVISLGIFSAQQMRATKTIEALSQRSSACCTAQTKSGLMALKANV